MIGTKNFIEQITKVQNKMHIMAAGSLRGVLTAIIAEFNEQQNTQITCEFGPAGLLRQKIVEGAECDLFLSANYEHPHSLLTQNIAYSLQPFTANKLSITTTIELAKQYPDFLQLLFNPELIIGTSTPIDDPGGDYAMLFYDRLSRDFPEQVSEMRSRTRHLVGGKNTLSVPAGYLASEWLIQSNQANLFIGYHHYHKKIEGSPLLTTIQIPDEYNVKAQYYLAMINARAELFVEYILSTNSVKVFNEHGFISL